MPLTLEQQLKAERERLQDRLKAIDLESTLKDAQNSGTSEVDGWSANSAGISRLGEQANAVRRRVSDIDKQLAEEERRLRTLQHWLTVESVGGISTIVLVKGSVYLLAIFTMPNLWWYSLLIVAALALTPLLLLTLIHARRFGWLTLFVVMVIVPCGVLFIQINDRFLTLAIQLFPLFMFYAYCVLLRYRIEDWLEFTTVPA